MMTWEDGSRRSSGNVFDILYVKPAPVVPREPTKEEIQAQKNREATSRRYYRLKAAAKAVPLYGLSNKKAPKNSAPNFNVPIATQADDAKTRRIKRGAL